MGTDRLHADTPILMADGTTRPIAAIRVGDLIYGTTRKGNYRHYVPTRVNHHGSAITAACRVRLQDGTVIITSADQRLLTERGWKHVTGAVTGHLRRAHLTVGNKLMGTGRFATPPKDTVDYRRGYLSGIARGDGGSSPSAEVTTRVAEYLSGDLAQALPIPWPTNPGDDWSKGFLAGVFDTDGTYTHRILRLRNLGPRTMTAVTDALTRFAFPHAPEPRRAATNRTCVRVDGGLTDHLRLFHTTDPATTSKRTIDDAAIKSKARLGVIEVRPLGLDLPLFHLTTDTGDAIANGVITASLTTRKTPNREP